MIFVGYDNLVDRAGLIYYNSRPSKLYWLEVRDEDLKKPKENKDNKEGKEKEASAEKESKESSDKAEIDRKLVVLTPNDHSPV